MNAVKTEFSAKVTISRSSRENLIEIVIGDDDSGSKITRVAMLPRDFAMALTGLAEVEGVGTFYNGACRKVGKTMETLPVVLPDGHHWMDWDNRTKWSKTDEDKAKRAEFVAALEGAITEAAADAPTGWQPGWQLHFNGIGRKQEGPTWRASMVRWVDPTPPTEEQPTA